ncbi:hypothetical protein KC19_1G200600 [Ceratodon purpureus]|uniref:Uncharacterized protein n=1 Tax=Ceratodon purpureus TaxID=3225 RepID=A0A8T0J9Y2_CERPU|nr:hypothetical protein KC19_1G200600 [Ceratodon purpureus]
MDGTQWSTKNHLLSTSWIQLSQYPGLARRLAVERRFLEMRSGPEGIHPLQIPTSRLTHQLPLLENSRRISNGTGLSDSWNHSMVRPACDQPKPTDGNTDKSIQD